MSKSSESFCILPWLHLYKNMDDGVKLCCTDRGANIGSLKTDSIQDIRNSKEFNKLRESFLNGEKLSRCGECWQHENNGYRSYRQSMNFAYKDIIEETDNFLPDKPLDIRYVDYRPSNICNLACKICSPRFSSKLIDPWLEAGQISNEEASELTKLNNERVSIEVINSELKKVDNVYFAGGEPMIADDHWTLLEKLISKNSQEIALKYNTNLTHLSFKGKSVEEYWPKFKKVLVGASLDGIGTEFNHVRTGGKWETIVKNLNRVKDLTEKVKADILKKHNYPRKNMGIELLCESTVGWLNLKSVFKLHKFLVENEYVTLDDPFMPKIEAKPLNFPYGASLDNTPALIKEELLEEIEGYKQWLSSVHPYVTDARLSDIDSLSVMVQSSVYDEAKMVEWLKLNKVIDTKYRLNTPETFKFKNEDWNRKFKQLYEYGKLI